MIILHKNYKTHDYEKNFLAIIFLAGSFSFSQVEQGSYVCKYYKAYDAEDGVYNLSESEWVDVIFTLAQITLLLSLKVTMK